MSNDNTFIAGSFRDPTVSGFSSSRSNILALVEGIVLLGGVAYLQHSGLMSFANWPVHPFMFIAILLSAQYGVLGGILAAMGATALTYFNGLPIRPFGMSQEAYFLVTWADPLSWAVAALMVGIVTSHRTRKLEEQGERLRKALIAEGLIAAQYQVLAQRTHKLERSLAGRPDVTIATSASVVEAGGNRGKSSSRLRNRPIPSLEP